MNFKKEMSEAEAIQAVKDNFNAEKKKRLQRIKEINYSLSLIERNVDAVKLKIERNKTLYKEGPRLEVANKEFRDLLREYRINERKLKEELHYWENNN